MCTPRQIFSILVVVAGVMASLQSCIPSQTEWDTAPKFPLKSTIRNVQPMTGIVLWNTHRQRATDAITLEYTYFKYSDVVVGKDEYDWSVIDNVLEDISKRGHQAIIRFWYTYPNYNPGGVPQYIKEMAGYEPTIGLSEGKVTEFPDWRHAELKRFHLDFYKRFALRYNQDKRLAFLQTGFGLWAEYHIYNGPRVMGQTFPSKEFQKEFFEVMRNSFVDLTWSISIDAAASSYSPFAEEPLYKEIPFGLFDDSFMHEGHANYNTPSWLFFGAERYKTSPCGGEFGYYTAFDQQNVLNPEGIHGRTFESEAQKFHITYMIGNNQPSYQTTDRIKEAGMACGYKFQITDCRVLNKTIRVTILNKGVAPLYRDAYLAVDGERSTESLKGLVGSDSIVVTMPFTSEQPTITIECDHLVGNQIIEFEANI